MQAFSRGPRASAAVFLTLGLLACSDQPAGPSDTSATLSPTRQWSGGSVTLQGALVREVQTGFVVTAGSDTLAWTRVNDSTVTLQLPSLPSQTLDLQFRSPGYTGLLGQVEVAGYNSVKVADRSMYNLLTPWPLDAPDLFLGAVVDTLSHVAVLDPVSGHVTTYPAMAYYQYSYAPGFSYRPGVVVLSPSANVWQLSSVPDSLGSYGQSDQRQAFELAPGRLLVTGPHSSWTTESPDSGLNGVTRSFRTESPWHLFFSPNRSLAVLGVSNSPGGIPVFDTQTGDTAYTIPAVQAENLAAFSPDGTTIYLTGYQIYPALSGAKPSLTKVNAADGSVVDQVDLAVDPVGLVLDAPRNRIYVAAPGPDSAPGIILQVYDATSLQMLAQFSTPAGTVDCTGGLYGCWDAAMLVSRTGNPALYVVPLGPNQIIKFDLVD